MTTNENVKRKMSRRETLRWLGAAGAIALVGVKEGWATRLMPATGVAQTADAATFACVAKPALTEGPYFVDERLNRSDIRSDPMTGVVKRGVPLKLTFNVHRLDDGACTPLPGAYVDVWHTDADGVYSNVGGSGAGQKFLRGYQMTDESGLAQFTTIYPGWYQGRTTHIHFKIRLFAGGQKTYEFTSQLFFDDSVSSQVYSRAPYSTHGQSTTTNARDGIYGQSQGRLTLALVADGSGYAGTFDIALEGVPGQPTGGEPEITGALMRRRKLVVTGVNFGSGAAILLDGEEQTTRNNPSHPTTVLVSPKMGSVIDRGEAVTIQVRNPDGTLSNEFA